MNNKEWWLEDGMCYSDEEERLNQLIGVRCVEIYKFLKRMEVEQLHKFNNAVIGEIKKGFKESKYSKVPDLVFETKLTIYFSELLYEWDTYSENFYFDNLRACEEYFIKKTFDITKYDKIDGYITRSYYDLDWLNDPKEIEKLENMR